MEIRRYHLTREHNSYILVVYLDPQLEEYSRELGDSPREKRSLQQQINKLIKVNFPNVNISATKVMVGTALVATMYMGPAHSAEAQTTTTQVQQTNQFDTYKVQHGDSLSVIAKRFNITVSAIKEVNGLTSDTIFVGQALKLPYYTYTVVSGDSLSVIAKRYNTTLETIRTYNQLSNTTIYIGQKIKIPRSTLATPTPTPTPAPTPSAPKEEPKETVTPTVSTYTVVSGDSLSVIAKKLSSTIDAIKSLNNLTTDTIYIGQVLKISQTQPVDTNNEAPNVTDTVPIPNPTQPEPAPTETPTVPTYTVVSGDSLSVIAKRFGTTVEAIKTANQLTADTIYVGQKLMIPSKEIVMSDTTAPSEPVIDNKQSVTVENVRNYTLFGLAEPGATVQISLSDGIHPPFLVSATVNESGEFRTSIDLRTLNDGTLTVLSTTVDSSGNKSRSVETTIIKDTSLAPPVIENPIIINSQNVNSYPVFGIAQPNATIDLIIQDNNNQKVSASVRANEMGEFHVHLNVSALNDSELSVLATQTSLSGIKSQSGKSLIVKDTTAPGSIIFHNNNIINQDNQNSYLLLGKGEANSKVNIKISNRNGQVMEINEQSNEKGEFRIPVDLSSFQDGDIQFELSQIDPAGNISLSSFKTLQKDTVGPTFLQLSPHPVIFNGNVENYSLTGSSEPFVKLDLIFSDGVTNRSESVTTDANGQFQMVADLSSLKDGEITVSITGTDQTGNSNELQSITIVKDTLAPEAAVTSVAPYVNSLNKRDFSITGESSEEAAQVTIVWSDGTTIITKTATVLNGKFQSNVDLSSMNDGPITVEMTQTDKAGNKGTVNAQTLEKDTVVENPLIAKNGYSYENNRQVYTVIGMAEPNATIHASILNGNNIELFTKSTVADGKGYYSLKVYLDEAYMTGATKVSVTQVDKASNKSEVTSINLYSHSVASGETLYSIAKRYNTTVEALSSLNNLTSDVILPNQTLRLPITASEVVNLGYMYFGNKAEYVNKINQTSSSMNTVSPSYFDINPDGTLKLNYSIDPDFIATMHKQGIRVVPFLSNHWNRDIGRAMLDNKEQAAQQIADAVARYHLDGVNVDIENVTDKDRENYTEFVRLLREKIPKTKEVSVAVAANPNGWTVGWHGSYDYTGLAKYADYLMIMSYDESYPGGEAGPVASAPWVEKSVQYAINQNVPTEKIVIGIAHFGRYWIEGASYGGFGISNWQVEDLINKYNGTVIFDERSKSPKATITIKEGDPKTVVGGSTLAPGTYTIWFENEESIRQKLSLIGKYNLRGVGNWSIGQEAQEVWNSYATVLPTTVPITSPVDTATEVTSDVPTTTTTYTVVSGDSLSAIAKRFNTTVSAIKEENKLPSDIIYVGQKLTITTAVVINPDPAPTVSTITYSVVSGDSLSVIAKRYNTTVTAIKEKNKLTSDNIYIGQKLIIPV